MLIGAAGALSQLASALRPNNRPASFQPASDEAQAPTAAQSSSGNTAIDTATSKVITDLKSLLLSVQASKDPSTTPTGQAAAQTQQAQPTTGHHHHHHKDADASGSMQTDPLARISQALKAYDANNTATAAASATTSV